MSDLVHDVVNEDKEPSKEQLEAAIRAQARPASLDTEEALAELKRLADQKTLITKQYEELRDEVVGLLEDGPRYFIGPDGAKYYAVRNQTKPIDVDLEELIRLFEDNPELLEQVAPRKVDKAAFRQAVKSERITREQLLQVARMRKNAPFVRFHYLDAE